MQLLIQMKKEGEILTPAQRWAGLYIVVLMQ